MISNPNQDIFTIFPAFFFLNSSWTAKTKRKSMTFSRERKWNNNNNNFVYFFNIKFSFISTRKFHIGYCKKTTTLFRISYYFFFLLILSLSKCKTLQNFMRIYYENLRGKIKLKVLSFAVPISDNFLTKRMKTIY